MLRYFIFIEYGLLPDLRVGVLISASQKVRIKFAACSENAVQKAVVKAAENGSKLRCVYAGHGQEPMICGMSVTDISVSDGELFGHVIDVTLSM